MAYEIEGRLLEVCTCEVICPCWVGRDPDGGTCDSALAWGIDKGTIDGTDVSGLTLALSVHIPGNVLTPKSWKAAVLVDERATDEQQAALLKVFTGQAGGPIADLAGAHRRGGRGRAGADHVHGPGWQGSPADRRASRRPSSSRS